MAWLRASCQTTTIALVFVLGASCREPAQVSVVITTDVKCPDVKGTSLTIGNLMELDQRLVTTETSACVDGRIGELVVVPSGEDDDTVAIRVVMGLGRDSADCAQSNFGPGCIEARRALRYTPHAHLTLPIFMAASCSGVACGATQTCVRGNCREATITDSSACQSADGCTESSLAPATPPPPPDAGPVPCASDTVCDVVTSTTVVDVAVTTAALFWLDSSGAVMTSALDGTNARVLVSGETTPLAGIEADANYVFWTANGSLRRASASTGAGPTTLKNLRGGCLRWMVPGSRLLAGVPAAGRIYVYDVGADTLSSRVSNADTPWGVAGPALNDFFYTNFEGGRIRRVDRPRGTFPILLTGQSGPRCMATDGTSLWWANNRSGELMRSTTAGANLQPIASDQAGIAGVALDATWIYWSWRGGIRKLTK